MDLGTYKVVKRPNQYTPIRRLFYWFKNTRLMQWTIKKVTAFIAICVYYLKISFGVSIAMLIGAFIFGTFTGVTTHYIMAETPQTHELPLMLQKVCQAESGNRQFNAKGTVLRGKVNPSDIGYCQINEPYWNDTARSLGYDIYTEQGNKDMAIYLFENYGTEPWNSSKPRWNK